jgi:hypothetical protein
MLTLDLICIFQVKRRRRLKKHLAKTASTGKVVTKAELSNLWVMAAADDNSADELSDNEEEDAKEISKKEAILRREEVRTLMSTTLPMSLLPICH